MPHAVTALLAQLWDLEHRMRVAEQQLAAADGLINDLRMRLYAHQPYDPASPGCLPAVLYDPAMPLPPRPRTSRPRRA